MQRNAGLHIIFVDDEKNQRDIMQILLENEGYHVRTAHSAARALEELKKEPADIVVTDLRMEGQDGIALLQQIHQIYPQCKVILLTGYGSIENAVEAMKKGAWSYFVKGQGPETLLEELKKLQAAYGAGEASDSTVQSDFMLNTKSSSFQKVLRTLERAAKSSAHILLLGESGVGKEVMADYIHRNSRPDKKFIAVNCHALSENLIESELFGHEKGAFTGAAATYIGRFEAVKGGTLFLDEIGDIPLHIQAKLLRTLETGTIERVGSTKNIPVDYRLIGATNVDLETAMMEGRFREDLYYRLSTITVVIPPLRERKEDLPDLIRFFLEKFERQLKKGVTELPRDVWDALLSYSYKGNVRELRNVIERLVVLSENGVASVEDLPGQFMEAEGSCSAVTGTLKEARIQAEREQILLVLEKNSYKVKESAAALGISERQLFNKFKEYHVDLKQYKRKT